MTDVADSPFHKGQSIWVVDADGSMLAAEYVGEGELSTWLGGVPSAIVVYPDRAAAETVEIDRIIPRE